MLAILKVLKKALTIEIKNVIANVYIRTKELTCNQQVVGSTPITSSKLDYVVIIARRIHLFPFRTQKLSS